MPPADFVTELIMSRKLLSKPKALVKTDLALAPLRYGGFVGLDGAVAPGEQRPNVLGRRGRREGALEDP